MSSGNELTISVRSVSSLISDVIELPPAVAYLSLIRFDLSFRTRRKPAMFEAALHIARATQHSIAGLRYLVRSEMAARIEVGAGVLALLLFIVLRRSAGEILLLFILFCVLLSVEAL